ncbi:RNA-binding domain-containing protein [Streptococcus sp. NLN76]|uniref:ATP-binding protein n=1 Tax=Streptococcus sp. NLN76 TaxID=2822800 RepID=UPI0018A8B41D|nr:RNA-binding domain-containing protein [Streptococcus sp. NLN76]MBF8970201.1 putative DNA binding domain-containing protein [Streptococcus sp. NLN76]
MKINLNFEFPEGIDMEYKKAKNSIPDSLWETYSAFANTTGGVIILGVDEKAKPPIQGVQNAQKMYDDLLNQFNNPQKISCNLISDNDISILRTKEEKNLIIINVREAPYQSKPVYLKNDIRQTYIRLGEGDRLATPAQLKYLITISQNDIDSEILPNFDIDDLNPKTLIKYQKLLAKQDSKYEDINFEEMLISIGAYKKDRNGDGSYKLTTGGLLFFGRYNSIVDRFPHFQLDYFEKDSSLNSRWIDRVSTGDASFPELNIFEFFTIVLEKLFATTKDSFALDENQTRMPFKKDIEESLREALVNSLMHAYYDSDFPIKISAFPDYYEFYNPGNMRVTVEEFIKGNTSSIRNPTIATFLRRIGISEKAGSGGPKIFDTATKYQLMLPEIFSDFRSTTLRIWKVDIEHNLNKLQEPDKSILKFIMKNGSIKTQQIKEELGLKGQEYSYRNALDRLISSEYIERKGKGRGTLYILKQSSQEQYYLMKQFLKDIEDRISRK